MFAFVTMTSSYWIILRDVKEVDMGGGPQEYYTAKVISGVKVAESVVTDALPNALPTYEIRDDVERQYASDVFEWTLYDTIEKLITENIMEMI